ncbi:YceI family protein [Maribellus maritimus]|uniref:YceI family protein n=1 Tax=Maribellus maritimus TaxID=2870838 RepID=UPI001EEA6BE0|nr:YceI family protein [Maribellus maritimus]MCG6188805.1 YceI family protein [Maribellus maritimus]
MKKSNLKYLLLSVLIFSLANTLSFGQQQFKVIPSESKLVVSGTSSVHDWEIEAEEFSCNATISFNENSITEISNVNFTCPVESLRSNNKIMNNKTQKALNSDKSPEINFRLENSVAANLDKNSYELKGLLTINGTDKEVGLKFTYDRATQNRIKIEGEVPLKMSDFKIDPPTAMMGALKTADEIKVTYNIILENK